jgi:hypothetical protein
MASLDRDTRMIMTILFVGLVSGSNVYFYAEYGLGFPYTTTAHGLLFGLITVGAILMMKALNDLALNDKIESWLLDRRIIAYWNIKSKEEEQRKRMGDSLKTFQNDFQTNRIPITYETPQDGGVSSEFLAKLQ